MHGSDLDKWIERHLVSVDELPENANVHWRGKDLTKEILQQNAHLWLRLGNTNTLIWSLKSFADSNLPLTQLPIVVAKNKKIDGYNPDTLEYHKKESSSAVKASKFEIMAFHGFLTGKGKMGAHIIVPRVGSFAPIKDKEGEGVDTAERAARIYSQLNQEMLQDRVNWTVSNDARVELSPSFAFGDGRYLSSKLGENGLIGRDAQLYLSGKNVSIGNHFRLEEGAQFILRFDDEYNPEAKVEIGNHVTVTQPVSFQLLGKGKVIIEDNVVFDYPLDFILKDGEWLQIDAGTMTRVRDMLEFHMEGGKVFEEYEKLVRAGDLKRAFLIRKLADSYFEEALPDSPLYRASKWLRDEIEKFDQSRRSEIRTNPFHEAEPVRLADVDEFIAEVYKTLEQIYQGAIEAYSLTNIKQMNENSPSLYGQADQDLMNKSVRKIHPLLAVEGRNERLHDLPGFLNTLLTLFFDLFKEPFAINSYEEFLFNKVPALTDEDWEKFYQKLLQITAVVITDGGLKTRAGNETLGRLHSGLWTFINSLDARTLNLAVNLTILKLLPKKIRNEVLIWSASDNYTFLGASDLPKLFAKPGLMDDFAVITSGARVTLIEQAELEILDKVIMEIGQGNTLGASWDAITGQEGQTPTPAVLQKRKQLNEQLNQPPLEKIRERIRNENLRELGIMTAFPERHERAYELSNFYEKQKDDLRIIQIAHLNEDRGYLYKNPFGEIIHKEIVVRLLKELSSRDSETLKGEGQDYAKLDALPVSYMTVAYMSRFYSKEDWKKKRPKNIDPKDWDEVKMIFDNIFDPVLSGRNKIYVYDFGRDYIWQDTGHLHPAQQLFEFIAFTPQGRKSMRLPAASDQNIVNSNLKVGENLMVPDGARYLISNVWVEGGGQVELSNSVILSNVILYVPQGEIFRIPRQTQILDAKFNYNQVVIQPQDREIGYLRLSNFFPPPSRSVIVRRDENINTIQIDLGQFSYIHFSRSPIYLSFKTSGGFRGMILELIDDPSRFAGFLKLYPEVEKRIPAIKDLAARWKNLEGREQSRILKIIFEVIRDAHPELLNDPARLSWDILGSQYTNGFYDLPDPQTGMNFTAAQPNVRYRWVNYQRWKVHDDLAHLFILDEKTRQTIRYLLEAGNNASKVKEMYDEALKTDLNKAAVIRDLIQSFLDISEPESNLRRGALYFMEQIGVPPRLRSELRSGEDQEGPRPIEGLEISGDILNEINRLNPDLTNQLSGFFDLETDSTQGNYTAFHAKRPLILESPDGSKFRFDLSGKQKPGGTLLTIETYDLSGSRKYPDAYFDFRMVGDAAYADFEQNSSEYGGLENAIEVQSDQKERNLGSILVTLGLYWTKLHGAKRFNLAYVETPAFFEKIGFVRKESPVLGTEYMFDLEKGSLPALLSISLPDAGAGEIKRVLEKAALKPEILRHPQAREQALHSYNAGVGGLIPIVKDADKKALEVIPYEILSVVDSKSQTAYLRHLASGERLFVIFAAGRSTRMKMPAEFDRLGIAGLNPAILMNLPQKRIFSQEDFAQAKLLIDDAARGNIKTLEDLSFIQRQFLQLRYQLERLVESNPQSGLKLQDVLKGISFLVIVNPANRHAIAKQLSAVSFAGLEPARVFIFEQKDKGGVEILTDGTTRPYADKKWPRGHGEPFLSMKNKTSGGYRLNAQGAVEEIKGDRLAHVLGGISVKRAFIMKVNDLPLLEDMALLERWAASSRLQEEGASMVVELVDNKIGQEAGGAFRRNLKYMMLRDSIAMKDPALSPFSIPETSSRFLYDMDWDQYTRQTVLPLPPYLMERVTPDGKAVLTLEYKSGDLTSLFNTLAIKQPGFELRTFKDRARIPTALAATEKQNAQQGFSEMAEKLVQTSERSEIRNEEEGRWDLENDLPELFWGERLEEIRQKFEYDDDGVRGGKILSDRQEAAFSIRLAANLYPASQRKRFSQFYEMLAGSVGHSRLKLYLPDFDRLRIALVGRYSEFSGVDLMQKNDIERVLDLAVEKIKQSNIENFSIQVHNAEVKKDGSIVLNLIPNPNVAKLRYLLHDAFVEALEEKMKGKLLGAEKQQFRLPEEPDAGVITIGRIIPSPRGVGPVINATDLKKIKAAIDSINWSLMNELLYIEAERVSLIQPEREFLEQMTVSQERAISLMTHQEMDVSNTQVQGIFNLIRQSITTDETADFRQNFSRGSQDILKALKLRLVSQARAWELGLEDQNVPEWKRLFWSWQVHSILWLINDQYLKQPDAVDQAQDEDRKAIQLLAKAREGSFIQNGRIPSFKISEDPRELYQRVIDWISSPLGQGIKIQSFVKLPPNTGYEGSAILASALMQAILALIHDPQAPSVTVTSGLRVQTSSAGGSDMFGWAIRNGMTMVHGTFYIKDQPPVVVRVERLPGKELIFESIDLNKREEISEKQGEFSLPKNGDALKHLKAALALSVSFSKEDIAALMQSPDRKRKMAFLGSVLEGLPQVGIYGGVNNLAATVGGGFVYTSNQPGDYDPKPVTIANAKQLRQFQAHSRLFNPGIRKQVTGDVSTAGRQIKRALLVGTNQNSTLQFMHELGGDTRNMPRMIRRGNFIELADSINNVQIWTDKIIGNATRKALANGEPVSLQALHAFLDDVKNEYGRRTKTPLGVLVQGAGPIGGVLFVGEKMNILDKILKKKLPEFERTLKHSGIFDETNRPALIPFDLTDRPLTAYTQLSLQTLDAKKTSSIIRHPDGFRNYIQQKLREQNLALVNGKDLNDHFLQWYKTSFKKANGTDRKLRIEILKDGKEVLLRLDDAGQKSLGHVLYSPVRDYQQLSERSEIRISLPKPQASADSFAYETTLEFQEKIAAAHLPAPYAALDLADIQRNYPAVDAKWKAASQFTGSFFQPQFLKMSEPMALRMIQLLFADAGQTGLPKNQIHRAARKALGEYAWLLDPRPAPIHLIQTLGEGPVKAEDYMSLYLLGLVNRKDRVTLILPHADAQKVLTVKAQFDAEAGKLGMSDSAGRLSVVAASGAGEADVIRRIKQTATKSGNYSLGTLHESTEFLEKLGYIGRMSRVHNAGRLNQNTAVMITAVLLREQLANDYTIVNLESWMREHGVDAQTLSNRVSRMIEALKHIATQA